MIGALGLVQEVGAIKHDMLVEQIGRATLAAHLKSHSMTWSSRSCEAHESQTVSGCDHRRVGSEERSSTCMSSSSAEASMALGGNYSHYVCLFLCARFRILKKKGLVVDCVHCTPGRRPECWRMAEYAPLGVHGSAAAAPPSDSLTIQLYVPIEPCLALASQPGAKIEQQTGCKLTVLEVVPEAVAVDRLVKVTGTLAGVNKAAELILDLTPPPLAALDPPASDGLPPAAPMCLLKLALTNAQVGGVIGKSGATIRQIREDSGAAIKVDAGRGTPDNPRLMSISGNRTAVVKAHLHTIFKLATLPEDGGGAACSTPPNSAPTHQFVKATAHLGSPQQQQQVRQQGWGGACGVPESPPPAYGFLAGHGCAPCGYSAVSGSWAPPQMTQATLPMGAGGIGSMGGLGNIGAMAQTLAMDTREQLVPAPLIGNLIGKGGSAIREIRQLSGANIKISQGCEPGTEERKVTVSGAPMQASLAASLTASLTASPKPHVWSFEASSLCCMASPYSCSQVWHAQIAPAAFVL